MTIVAGQAALVDVFPDASLPVCYITLNTTKSGDYLLSILQGGDFVSCKPFQGNCLNPLRIQVLAGKPNLDISYFLLPRDTQVEAGGSLAVALFSQDFLGNAVDLSSIAVMLAAVGGEPVLCSVFKVRSAAMLTHFMTSFAPCSRSQEAFD